MTKIEMTPELLEQVRKWHHEAYPYDQEELFGDERRQILDVIERDALEPFDGGQGTHAWHSDYTINGQLYRLTGVYNGEEDSIMIERLVKKPPYQST